MGKYTRLSRQSSPRRKPWQVHPIWRGIGCILVLIGPIMAYAAATFIVDWNVASGWYAMPVELTRPVTLPYLGLTPNHFYGNLMVTGLLLLLGFALIMVIYALVYALVGPSRFGPMDARPIRRKVRPSR